ncbi:MAG: energy transducer TonB [Bacteroidales bacterium]|nr:energy transducer TonB [Bacteroidales bacterium]
MKLNRKGLIGTITIHGLMLALLVLGGLTFPFPPPEEKGVLVNFGTDDTGYGNIEPEGDESSQGEPFPDAPEETAEPGEITPVESNMTEDIPADNTQDVEEVVVKEDPEPTAEEIMQQQEAERIKERERIQREEEERIRLEQEAERQRVEKEEREREEQANRLNNLGRNTFGQQGVGEEEGSEGVDPGTGNNQGTDTGTPGAANYGEGSGLGDGPSYGLGSRKAVGTLPLPNVDNCNVTSRIVVTVEIQVDRSGKVVSANVASATFADNCIWKEVVEAARKTTFTSDPNAAFKQTGWIKYTIEP